MLQPQTLQSTQTMFPLLQGPCSATSCISVPAAVCASPAIADHVPSPPGPVQRVAGAPVAAVSCDTKALRVCVTWPRTWCWSVIAPKSTVPAGWVSAKPDCLLADTDSGGVFHSAPNPTSSDFTSSKGTTGPSRIERVCPSCPLGCPSISTLSTWFITGATADWEISFSLSSSTSCFNWLFCWSTRAISCLISGIPVCPSSPPVAGLEFVAWSDSGSPSGLNDLSSASSWAFSFVLSDQKGFTANSLSCCLTTGPYVVGAPFGGWSPFLSSICKVSFDLPSMAFFGLITHSLGNAPVLPRCKTLIFSLGTKGLVGPCIDCHSWHEVKESAIIIYPDYHGWSNFPVNYHGLSSFSLLKYMSYLFMTCCAAKAWGSMA